MRNKQPYRVAAGAQHSFIVTRAGYVFVFGSNSHGQLGIYDELHKLPDTAWPLVIPKLVEVYCVDVSAFGHSSIALETMGVPLVWGANKFGQLRRDASSIFFPKPVDGVDSKRIVRVAAGGSHTLFLDSYGQVYTQGSNLFGQLGYESSDTATGQDMHPVDGLGLVLVIAAGLSHSAAVNKNQQLFMWGRNTEGQLGTGTTQSQAKPQLVPLQRVVRVACGYYHTLAVTADGKIYSWGKNNAGQLGLKDFKTRTSPFEIRISSTAIWCDSYDSTTISESFQNQVCVNSKLTISNVVLNEPPLPLNVTIMDVFAGALHSAAITIDRNIFLWGSNEQNQLAMGPPSIVGRFFYEPFWQSVCMARMQLRWLWGKSTRCCVLTARAFMLIKCFHFQAQLTEELLHTSWAEVTRLSTGKCLRYFPGRALPRCWSTVFRCAPTARFLFRCQY